MEANEYDSNHLDTDVLLPPRKRLLAGMKRQSSESPSKSSLENSSPSPLSEFDVRLQNLLKLYRNGPHMSSEEIAKAAGSAATAAAMAAEAARAVAEEKAAIAGKAVKAAKNALSLVACFSKATGSSDGQSRKNKLKKHVPVEFLYKEQQVAESCGTDEELARKLHRAINSSPRITKHSPGSKNKHKKLKPSLQDESIGAPNGVVIGDGKSASPCEVDDMQEDADSEASYEESYVPQAYEKAWKPSEPDQIEENRVEEEARYSRERTFESSDSVHTNGRKRGRVKQKKLPLSLCSSKDRTNPKDGPSQNSLEPNRSAAGNMPVSPLEPHASKRVPIEPAPSWKCQDFKVPQCIKPNKVVQS